MTRLSRRSALSLAFAAAGASLWPRRSLAQGYPTHTVRIIVPWAPGGSTDILARIVGEHLRRSLGQPVIIENKPGASGNLGSDLVAKAEPDGHTILFGSMSTHAMNHALFSSMPFNGVEDFTPIALLAFVTNTMVINPMVPAKTVREFVDYAKTHPGKIAYASAGAGSTNHLCAALFEKVAGVQMVHVPYRGGAPAVLDTVAGQTQLLFSAGTQTLEHVRAGKLTLLAVTEGKRAEVLPDVPTVAETLPGYEMAVWYGAFGPRDMSRELVVRLNAEINRILFLPEVKQKMADIAVEVVNATPQELGTMLRADAEKWGKLIKELGIGA